MKAASVVPFGLFYLYANHAGAAHFPVAVLPQ
jgi:hypothetical protein